LLLLSEVVAGSDSGKGFSPFSVRGQGRFGLWHIDFPFFCPKLWQVRTLAHEVVAGTDSMSVMSFSPVQTNCLLLKQIFKEAENYPRNPQYDPNK
ncbi:hypothetical protein, partial [Cytobacillus oceanisediminis]|uniref:hypothetical protein n=1 Tax=Cytobacillus oceanisediminis TaxID=665099 RepID=UPI001C318AF4